MAIKGTKTWDDIQVWKYTSGATQAGSYDTSGNWVLGPTAATNTLTFNGLASQSYQASAANNFDVNSLSTSFSSATRYKMGGTSQVYVGVSAANDIITGAAAGDTCISTNNKNILFSYDNGAKIYGQLSSAGAWTFGNLTNNSDHIIQSNDNVPLILKSTATTCHLQFVYSTSTTGGYIRTASGVPLNFLDQASTTMGNATSTGWTFGPSDATAVATAKNSAATASSTKRGYDSQYTVDTDCTGGYFFAALNSSGTIIARCEATTNTNANWVNGSDSRLKQDPQTFNGLALIAQMTPRDFEWKSNPGSRGKGFYAQEMNTIMPEIVCVGTDDLTEDGSLVSPWGIDYGKLTPVLVKALQELKQQFDDYVIAHP